MLTAILTASRVVCTLSGGSCGFGNLLTFDYDIKNKWGPWSRFIAY